MSVANARAGCAHCRRPVEFVAGIGWLHVLMSSGSADTRCEAAWPMSYANAAQSVGFCPCGHHWHAHDVNEYRGDGSEMCCVSGCNQAGCPGRVDAWASQQPPPT